MAGLSTVSRIERSWVSKPSAKAKRPCGESAPNKPFSSLCSRASSISSAWLSSASSAGVSPSIDFEKSDHDSHSRTLPRLSSSRDGATCSVEPFFS